MESIRPRIRQYFIESNTEGSPFDRETRDLVYERAKGIKGDEPFGTERDVRARIRIPASFPPGALRRQPRPEGPARRPARRKRSRWTFAAYGLAVILPPRGPLRHRRAQYTDRSPEGRPGTGLRAAVHRPPKPAWGGRRCEGQRLRCRQHRQSSVRADGRIEHPNRAAVHRPPRTYGCGDGCHWQRLRVRRRRRRVLKLAAGSSTQTVLPFTGLDQPRGLAVDAGGTVYVSVNKISGLHADSYLLSLAAGSNTWTRLPSAGVEEHVAADAADDVYVTASGDSEDVMRLAPGSAHWTEFPGLYLLKGPAGWRWTPAETCTSPAFWARAAWC
jgi:hypothetical protein